MISTRCPSCGQKLRVDESLAAAQCPACRTKFKVASVAAPATARKTAEPYRPSPNPQKQPAPATMRRRGTVADEEPVEVEAVEEAAEIYATSEPKEAPAAGEVEAKSVATNNNGDAPPRRKKKRKKRPEGEAAKSGLNTNLIVVGVMAGVGVAVVVGILVYNLLGSSRSSKPGIDPEVAAAELQKIGVQFERDNSKPDKPIVAIYASATTGDINGKNATWLEAFPKLRKLDLSHTKFNNVDLAHLEGMTELKELDLADTKVGDDIESLAKLTNLEKLNLSNTLVRDTGLMQLKGLKKLKSLSLGQCLADGRGLRQYLPNLKINQ